MAGTAPRPNHAQLASSMSQNAAQLRLRELRSGALVGFSSPADRTIAITDEKIQERFEFRKDALSLPERRTAPDVRRSSAPTCRPMAATTSARAGRVTII